MHIPPAQFWPSDTTGRHRHHHLLQQPWSRRRFVQTVAGATAVGAALGAGFWRPGQLLADGATAPVPIPGGSPAIAQFAGQLFHGYGPGPAGVEGFDSPDSEPSTITDFSGSVGLAYISGMVRRTHRLTGEVRELPFVNSDMRFMAGAYRGADGQVHDGTFAFI